MFFILKKVPNYKSEIIYCTVWICNISERGIIEIMTKKWFLLKVLYIFIVFWGSVTCNEKTVLANEYTIVDENAGITFSDFVILYLERNYLDKFCDCVVGKMRGT